MSRTTSAADAVRERMTGILGVAVLGGGWLIRPLFHPAFPHDLDAIGTAFMALLGAATLLVPVVVLWCFKGSEPQASGPAAAGVPRARDVDGSNPGDRRAASDARMLIMRMPSCRMGGFRERRPPHEEASQVNRRYVLVCALALLAGSSGATAWSGKGSWEPSTPHDRADGYMWPAADTSPAGKKVYFNGFLTDGEGLITSTSPNVGTLRTGVQPRAAVPMVMMGVWKDCNRDDFIGNGEASWIYPASLPGVDETVCPPTPGAFPTHNDGTWIYEFHGISWENRTDDHEGLYGDLNTLVDNHAKVWADASLPDAVLAPVCTVSPQPAGTYQSTGGALAMVDCQVNYRVTRTVNAAADATGLQQLSFADKPEGHQGESRSLLNVVYPLGESSDASYVSAWDCSQKPQQQHVMDPLGPREDEEHEVPGVVKFSVPGSSGYLLNHSVNTRLRSQPSVNQGGSFWGTLNETDASSGNCDRTDSCQAESPVVTTCGGDGTLGDLDHCVGGFILIVCEEAAAREFRGRVRPDSLLVSEQWQHNYTHEDPVSDVLDKQGDLYGSNFRKYWHTFDNVDNTGPVTRDLGVAPAQHWTFYGSLSGAAISRYSLQLPGVTGTYGAEACAASARDGLTRFDCDRSRWWMDADGTPTTPREVGSDMCWDEVTQCDPRAFVGDAYQLRDVDCYDYSAGPARENGLTTAHFAGHPC